MPLDPSLLQRIHDNDTTLTGIIFNGIQVDAIIFEMGTALNNSQLVLQITLNHCNIGFHGMDTLFKNEGISSIKVNHCVLDDGARRYVGDQFSLNTIQLLKSDGRNIKLEGNVLPSIYTIHKRATQTPSYRADNQSSSSSYRQANTSASREDFPRLASTYDRNWEYRQRAAEGLERLQRDLERLKRINPWLVLSALYDKYEAFIGEMIRRRQQNTASRTPVYVDRSTELDLLRRNDPSLRVLSLTSTDASYMSAFCQMLENNTQLTDLKIEGIELTADQIKTLAQHGYFQTLRLIGCQLSNEHAIFLAMHCTASTLDLSGNAISSTAVIALTDNTHITTLVLAHNAICDKGAEALARSRNIRSLDLSWNLITSPGAEALSFAVNLISLNLADNKVGDKGAKLLSNSNSITSLNLSHNNLSDECSTMLSENNILTILVIDRNHIGPAGAEQLSKSNSLAKLSLDQNDLGDDGASFLAKGYQGYWLSIGLNGITNIGAIELAKSKTITTLLVEGNLIGNDGAVLLVRNTKFTTLGLSGNRIGKKTLEALANNHTLTSVNIDDDLTMREPDYLLWLALIVSQDHRMLHIMWSLEHWLNNIDKKYCDTAKKKIIKNQENALELVLTCRDDKLNQVDKFRKIRASLGSMVPNLLPYGQYIDSELGYGDTLLHMAVRDENIPLLILLKNQMPRSISNKRDAFNMTYEDLALLLGLELPAEARLTQAEQTTAQVTLNTQIESDIIDQDPQLRQYYKELKEDLITLKIASYLVMKGGLMYNSSATAQGLSTAAGVVSETVASLITWLGNQIEVYKRNSLAEWLDDKETIIILARRLTYARREDILHSTLEQQGLMDRLGIFANKLKYGRQYTIAQVLACIDAEKLAAYIRDNKKPERQLASEFVDILLNVIMGASFKYQAPNSTPVINKGKAPVRQAVSQHTLSPPVLRQETTDVLVVELDTLRKKYVALEDAYRQLEKNYVTLQKTCEEGNKAHQKALKEKEAEIIKAKADLEITTSKYQTIFDLLEKYRARDHEQKNTATQSSSSSSSMVQAPATEAAESSSVVLSEGSAPVLTVFFSFDDHRIVNNSQYPQALPLTRDIREQRRHKSGATALSQGIN